MLQLATAKKQEGLDAYLKCSILGPKLLTGPEIHIFSVNATEPPSWFAAYVSRSIPDLPGARILFGSSARLRVLLISRCTGP